MKRPSSFDLKKVLSILECDSHSLKELAQLSGYDPFTFYRSADLRGLDLSGQDLTGMNFDHADLQGSVLSNVSYELGAFNNSSLPPGSGIIVDEFDSYLDDFGADHIGRLYVFAKIRGGTVEHIINMLSINYSDFASLSKISVATLRKARRSGIISVDTGSLLYTAIHHALQKLDLDRDQVARQPAVSFYEHLPQGGFRHIPREGFLRYLIVAERVYGHRKDHGYPSYMENWRDSPSMLRWLEYVYFGAEKPSLPTVEERRVQAELDFGLFARTDF